MKTKIEKQAAEEKNNMKRRITMKKFTALALILVIAATIIAPLATTSAAVAFPGVSASAYCEFVATKTIPVYRDSACTTRGLSNPLRSSNAEILANDKCKIITMTASYLQVIFPSSSGELTGFIKTKDLFLVTAPQAILASKISGRITTYVNTSGKIYGYTEGGDTVFNLGDYGNCVAIMYTAKSGSRAWMYGFVTKGDYDKIVSSTIVAAPTPTPVPITGTSKTLNVPRFRQSDERWGGRSMGSKTVSSIGCAVCCVAMLEAYKKNANITPLDILDRPGQITSGGAMVWGVAGLGTAMRYFGEAQYAREIYNLINNNNPVIIQYSENQHYVIAYGYKDVTKDASGNPVVLYKNILIHDPGSTNQITLDQYVRDHGLDGIYYYR